MASDCRRVMLPLSDMHMTIWHKNCSDWAGLQGCRRAVSVPRPGKLLIAANSPRAVKRLAPRRPGAARKVAPCRLGAGRERSARLALPAPAAVGIFRLRLTTSPHAAAAPVRRHLANPWVLRGASPAIVRFELRPFSGRSRARSRSRAARPKRPGAGSQRTQLRLQAAGARAPRLISVGRRAAAAHWPAHRLSARGWAPIGNL